MKSNRNSWQVSYCLCETYFSFPRHLCPLELTQFNAMSFTVLFGLFLGALVLYVAKTLLSRQRSGGPLPPGPRRTPVLGNISDLPPPGAQDWLHWLQHKEVYGLFLPRSLFSKTHADKMNFQDRSALSQCWDKPS